MAKWSKLRKDLDRVVDLNLIDIKCISYPMKSQWGSNNLPRYFIQYKKEIVFDFPKDFKNNKVNVYFRDEVPLKNIYPYDSLVSSISQLLRDYINSSLKESEKLEDQFGVKEFLWAGDKRIGKRKYKEYLDKIKNPEAQKILRERFES